MLPEAFFVFLEAAAREARAILETCRLFDHTAGLLVVALNASESAPPVCSFGHRALHWHEDALTRNPAGANILPMAAQVSTDTPKNPKALPDMSRISAMAEPLLNAVKKLRNGSRSVITGMKIENIEQITTLYDNLRVGTSDGKGPGIYLFEVFDAAGNDKDHWTVQLGAEDSAEGFTMPPANGTPMGVPPGVGAPGAVPGVPMNLGNGYFLTLFPTDPTRGMLTTPQRQVIPWREGMDLPTIGGGVPGFSGSASPVPGSNWGNNYSAMGMPGGMGMPGDDRFKFLEDQLANEKAVRKDDEHRRDIQAMEAKFEKATEAGNKRHEDLMRELTSKKSDPEIDALKESNRLLQQRGDEDKREREAQRREDAMKAELKASNDRFEKFMAEMSNNKADPMVTMLGNLMQTQQTSSQAMMTLMESNSRQQSEASREHSRQMADKLGENSMKPERLYELIRMAKDRGPEQQLQKEMSEAMRTVFGMMQEVVKMQADLTPGEPTWVGMLRQGMDQIGSLGQSFINNKTEANQAERIRQHNARVMQAQAEGRRAAAAAATPPAAVVADADEDDDDDDDDDVVETPTPGTSNHPDDVRARAAANIDATEKKAKEKAARKKKKRAAAAGPVVVPDAVEPPPGAAAAGPVLPEGMSPKEAVEHMASQPIDRIRVHVDAHVLLGDDEKFFGAIAPRLEALRAAVETGMTPDGVAETLLKAQVSLQAAGAQPPALEVMTWGHYLLVVERALPASDELFHAQVVESIEQQMSGAAA